MGFGFGGSKSSNKSSTEIRDKIDSEAGSGYEYDSGNRYGSGGRSGYDNWQGGNWQDQVFGGGQYQNMMNQFGNMFGNFMGPGGGQGQIDRSAGGAADMIGGVNEGAMTAYDRLKAGGATGAAGGAIDPALRESLQTSLSGPSQMGSMYESIVGGQGNTYIDPMIDASREDYQTGMDRSISGMNARTGAGGQQRGSRAGLAEGLMRSEGDRNQRMQEANMRGGAYDKDLQMKMDIARNADLGRGQAQDRAIGLLAGGDQNQQWAAGQGGMNMQNMAMGGMAPWMQSSMMPFQMGGMYSNMMGNPTVLGGGQYGGGGSGYQDQYSEGEGFDSGSGNSFETYMRDYFANQKSKGSSGSIGIGI